MPREMPEGEASALGHDRDYLALEDVKVLDRIVGAYWKTLSFLKSKIGAPLNEGPLASRGRHVFR